MNKVTFIIPILLYVAVAYGVMHLLKVPRRFWLPAMLVAPVIMSVGWVIWATTWGWWGAGIILILLLFAFGVLWVIKRVML